MGTKIFLTVSLIIAFISMAQSENKINITIDGRTLAATLADNDAAKALAEKLAEGPVTISMSNYGGFEKVGALPWSLPTSDTRLTTKPGDIMLYTGDNIVIFYGENTWAYTPLGVLDTTDPEEISNFVGNGNKQVTLSLDNLTKVGDVALDTNTGEKVFTLDGKEIQGRPLVPGIYIVNNKKVVIK